MFITTLDFRNNFEKEKKNLCCYELTKGVPLKYETKQKENEYEIYQNETHLKRNKIKTKSKRNKTKRNKTEQKRSQEN